MSPGFLAETTAVAPKRKTAFGYAKQLRSLPRLAVEGLIESDHDAAV